MDDENAIEMRIAYNGVEEPITILVAAKNLSPHPSYQGKSAARTFS